MAASEALRQVMPFSKRDPFAVAIINIGLGRKDEAFAALERLYENRSTALTSLKVNPYYDSLRTDPRFADLVRRVKLGN